MKFTGNAIKYGDNVDTDVIIPARYLNTIDKKELASHCMEDLDKTFITRVKEGDIIEITFGERKLKIKVLDVRDIVRKNDAQELYEVVSE